MIVFYPLNLSESIKFIKSTLSLLIFYYANKYYYPNKNKK